MSLCLARSIVDFGGLSLREIAESFSRWLRSGPRDVGNTCRRGIRRFMLDGSLEAPLNEGDAGNGAAMRMVPVALCSLADASLMERAALAQARLTHNHPLSDAACLLFGTLVQVGSLGLSRNRLRRIAESSVERFPSFGFQPYRGLSTAYVADTMATVLNFFFSTRSFEECLVAVVNQGGDADTTGAMAGAVAGAYYGMEEIPARWWKRLDPALLREIARLADALVDLSPLAHGVAPDLS
jgi:ADP-ribosyl-[dinitrogen reductase] hydrolase